MKEPKHVKITFAPPPAEIQWTIDPKKVAVYADIPEICFRLDAPPDYEFASNGLVWNTLDNGAGPFTKVSEREWKLSSNNFPPANGMSHHYTINVKDKKGNGHYRDDPEVENQPGSI